MLDYLAIGVSLFFTFIILCTIYAIWLNNVAFHNQKLINKSITAILKECKKANDTELVNYVREKYDILTKTYNDVLTASGSRLINIIDNKVVTHDDVNYAVVTIGNKSKCKFIVFADGADIEVLNSKAYDGKFNTN